MFRVGCLMIGYAFGCIQTAYVIARLFGKIDIRDHGSGNAGMTNITRVMGFKFGVVVFLLDVLKAVLAYLICSLIFEGSGTFVSGSSFLPGIYAAIGVILGHNFPLLLKFRGGKGIAASVGFILSFDWKIAVITFSTAIVIIAITRYISLAALIFMTMMPIIAIFFGYQLEAVILCFIITGVAYFQHRSNIVRLTKGTESKFSFRKKS